MGYMDNMYDICDMGGMGDMGAMGVIGDGWYMGAICFNWSDMPIVYASLADPGEARGCSTNRVCQWGK